VGRVTEGTAELQSGPGTAALRPRVLDSGGLDTGELDPGEVDVPAIGARIAEAMGRVVQGKPDVVRLALVVLLAEGHLLIEDVPGVGKTTLAKALARSIDGTVRRIQFTPDLLPSDVTGVAVYDQETRAFEFKPGAVFANLVVADEINRASPKTQSALLECMEERQVTVDGVTYELARPFMVLATQNPLEMEGTYPLPEAQRDRFTARISMGYPDRDAELAMLDERATADPLTSLSPVADAALVRALVGAVGRLHVAEPLRRYVVSLVEATRRSPDLRLGASPRAGLQLLRAARAAAALAGRDHVLPDDVQAMAVPVLAHRLLLTPDAALARRDARQVVTDVLATVPVLRGS
jgi:MoxR-like ATPase